MFWAVFAASEIPMAIVDATRRIASSNGALQPARPIIAPNERSKSCITRMIVSPPAITNVGAAAVRNDLAFLDSH